MKNDSSAGNRRQKVQSAEFGVLVLRRLAEMGGAATLTALSSKLEESPAKIHRYLASLRDAGLVRQAPDSGRYFLGPEAILIGLAAMRQADVLSQSAGALEELGERHDVTAFVATMGQAGPIIMRSHEDPAQTVTIFVRAGTLLPILWSATGRTFGAFCPPRQIDTLVRQELKRATPQQKKFIGTLDAANRLFADIRAVGYTSVRDVLMTGISAYAAPIFDYSGQPAGVLTVLGTSGRIDPSPRNPLLADLRQTTARISKQLGYGVKGKA